MNASNGIGVVASLGASLASPCRCYFGAWTVELADESCPRVEIDTTVVTVATFTIAGLVPVAMGLLLLLGQATMSGALTGLSVGLQVLDVVSDVSFTYQLAREQYCEAPVLVAAAVASIVAAIVVNGTLSVYLLRCWQVPGMRRHLAAHWSDVISVAFLSFFGTKALDLLTSGLLERDGLSLYSTAHPVDKQRKSQLSHRVRLLGIP